MKQYFFSFVGLKNEVEASSNCMIEIRNGVTADLICELEKELKLKYNLDYVCITGWQELETPKWFSSSEKLPEYVGDKLIVRTSRGAEFYAIYSGDDEFDVHQPTDDHRAQWYKYSKRTVQSWRYFNEAQTSIN